VLQERRCPEEVSLCGEKFWEEYFKTRARVYKNDIKQAVMKKFVNSGQ
jgi:hypothetical protein